MLLVCKSNNKHSTGEIIMNHYNREILRRLANELVEVATQPIMEERKRNWKNLNSLNSNTPLVLVSPEGAWREINQTIKLECDTEEARAFELKIRQKLYSAKFNDDMPIVADFEIAYSIEEDTWGVKLEKHNSDMTGGAYKPIPPLTDLSRDLSKLRFRKLKWDQAEFEQQKELAENTFGDILKVVTAPGYCFWTCGLTSTVINLMGMEEFLMGMYDQEENIHALMQFLTDDMEQYLDQLEKAGLLWYNNGPNLVGSGNCGLTYDLPSIENPVANITTKALWGLSESQETVGVSPEMFGEHIWPYQKKLLNRFGLGYYGCCEPIDKRLKYIKEASNIRAISVSPWADVENCANLVQNDYVLCHKVNPSNVCVNFNEVEIRKELRHRLDVCRSLNNMFILKDTHTISNEPERFKRWIKIFREESHK